MPLTAALLRSRLLAVANEHANDHAMTMASSGF
jgi:hypothetical protein